MKGLLEKEIVNEIEVESEDRALVISDEQGSNSVCSTCIHSGHCVYQGRNINPILFCEEFESERADLKQMDGPTKREIEADDGIFKGLCANCENRKTCIFADSISGIWHCEEYR